MWYLVIIAIAIVAILIIRSKKSGAAAKGGQALDEVKDPNNAQTVQAVVIQKDICTPAQKDSRPAFYYTPTQNKPQTKQIYGALHFQLESGKKKSFYVSKKDFRAVSEGYEGKLTFMGNHFIKFDIETIPEGME